MEIIVSPSELWGYYKSLEGTLHNQKIMIAQSDDGGALIYISEDDEPRAVLIAVVGGVEVRAEHIINQDDCEVTCKKFYNLYLPEESESYLDIEYDEDDDEVEDCIEERESELDDAVLTFVSDVLGDLVCQIKPVDWDDLFSDLKEHFLEYMARKHGLRIYRPMFVVDEDDGEPFLEDYPYECIEFEDEDNPIYKQ